MGIGVLNEFGGRTEPGQDDEITMSDLIQRHLEQLIGLFTRINPPVDLNSLRILHGKGDLAGMTQWTCDFMALGINIGVKPAASGAPVNEQAPMWIEARSSLPRIGTPEFSLSHANICFHSGTIEELPFELIVAGIAQALAHLVLHSTRHPLQLDGKAIDLTAMIFGFRGFGEMEIGFDEADIREMLFSSMPIPRLVHFGFLTGLEAIFAQALARCKPGTRGQREYTCVRLGRSSQENAVCG